MLFQTQRRVNHNYYASLYTLSCSLTEITSTEQLGSEALDSEVHGHEYVEYSAFCH